MSKIGSKFRDFRDRVRASVNVRSHNALFFFEDYLNTYFELAKENNLAVRTPHGIPFTRHKSFIQIVVALSAKNLNLLESPF